MHGFCGVLGLESNEIDKNTFNKSINLEETMKVDFISSDDFFLSASYLENAPLKGDRIYEISEYIFLFSGDLIGIDEVPWKEIENNFLQSNFQWFSSLRGFFAITVLNKIDKRISIFSDHRAQLPVYYTCLNNSFIFSTDLSTFTILKSEPEFNIEWLYEYLFFYFPVDRTTFLKNVSRLRPITKLDFDLNSNLIVESKYGDLFTKSTKIRKGKAVMTELIKMFQEIVPKYFTSKGKNLVAISAGFDSRNILSLAPPNIDIKTYSYGVEGCPDLYGVSKLMEKVQMNHEIILFDDYFERNLPKLIFDVVRLSGGIQPVLRASILHAYKCLNENKKDFNVVLGGIKGDFYRGILWNSKNTHESRGLHHYYSNKDVSDDIDVYKKAFGSTYQNYKQHIKNTLFNLTELYGDPSDAASKMNYDAYEKVPNSFGGEFAIASNYFTFRQPFLDIDLMQMAYKTEFSYIGLLNRFRHKKDISYKKYVLQAKMICSNKNFKRTQIRGLPIILFTYQNSILIKLSRLFIRGFAYLRGYRRPETKLEEWDKWFDLNLKLEFDKLLNSDSLILNYIDKGFMISAKNSKNIHLLGKIVTTEILLKLIKNRWYIK